MTIQEKAAAMKLDSPQMAAAPTEIRNNALLEIKAALLANRKAIFDANAQDLEQAQQNNIPEAVVKRLKFTEQKLLDVTNGLENLTALADQVHQVQFIRELDEGLTLVRESCPIGVIGVIFEARPDALVRFVLRAEIVPF